MLGPLFEAVGSRSIAALQGLRQAGVWLRDHHGRGSGFESFEARVRNTWSTGRSRRERISASRAPSSLRVAAARTAADFRSESGSPLDPGAEFSMPPCRHVEVGPKWQRQVGIGAVEFYSAQLCILRTRQDGGVSLLPVRPRGAQECDPTWSSGKRSGSWS